MMLNRLLPMLLKVPGGAVQATRYFLQDVETEEEGDPLVLEIVEPKADAVPTQFLFAITEAFEFDEKFVALLDDDVFIISEEHEDDTVDVEEHQYRKTSHTAATITTVDERNEIHSSDVKIWRYQREDEGDTWYLSIEVEGEDGWTTLL